MAYKYTKGSVNRGDLYAETSIDDDGDTYINFGDDSISLVANAVNVLEVGTANVSLPSASMVRVSFSPCALHRMRYILPARPLTAGRVMVASPFPV